MDNERPGDDEQNHQGQFSDETLGQLLTPPHARLRRKTCVARSPATDFAHS